MESDDVVREHVAVHSIEAVGRVPTNIVTESRNLIRLVIVTTAHKCHQAESAIMYLIGWHYDDRRILLLFVPVSSRKFQVLLPRHKVLFWFSHTSLLDSLYFLRCRLGDTHHGEVAGGVVLNLCAA